MQWLAALCVRRPVFTWVLVLSMVVVGTASIFGLGVDRFPDVDFPLLTITTVMPGASPEQVERDVTEPLEEALNSLGGLDELRSNSYEGLSVISAQFILEKPLDEASEEVRDRVSRTISQLPTEAEQPRVERLDPDAAPVMLIAIESSRSAREATEFADQTIRRRLESVNGVGGVSIVGGRERAVEIIVDPARLASFELTARDVQRALASENVEVPGGDVQRGSERVQLRVQGKVASPAEFGVIPVATRGNRVVRVSDVAEVRDGEIEPESESMLDGRQVVIVQVRKQSGANTVAVVDALQERVADLRLELPSAYQLTVVRDESEFIRNAVGAVQEHLIVGAILASIVVLLFLWNGRSTVIAALAIPTSIIATFALIRALGLTLNTITLLGLTLAVGIVIDDAIVVLENIVRFIEEKGYDAKRAAVVATQEIGLAVLATSLSLVAVFLPIAFMGGIIGRFMASFGYTMSFAILVSLVVSFTLTPMLSSRWLKGPVRGPGQRMPENDVETASDDLEIPDPPPENRRDEIGQYREWARGERTVAGMGHAHGGERGGVYGRIEAVYMKILAHCMQRRWVVGIALIATLASIVPLGIVVQKNFLPLDDESRFEITMRAAEGVSLSQMRLISERVAREVRNLPGVAHTVTTVGSPPGDFSGRGPNESVIFVSLVPVPERELSQFDVIGRVRSDVMTKFEAEQLRTIVSPVNAFGGGGAQSAAIQYVVAGPELAKLEQYTNGMLERIRQEPGVVDAATSTVSGRPSYQVVVDRPRAADLGVSVSEIANALRLLVGGVEVTDYSEGGETYEVRVRAVGDRRSSVEDIEQIRVPSAGGGSARLSDVATIERALGPSVIQHLARQRQVTVYSNVAPGGSEANVSAAYTRAYQEQNPDPGYRSSFAGRSRELGRTAMSFAFALVLSLAFMYLVLAAQFESWIHPVTILVSLPLTVPFALLSLVVLNQSINIFSMLGILVLFGVVKKNSILQVDHMRELRRKGLSRADAVMIGNRDRLRPILMTTMAFVAGMIPLVLSTGAGAGTNRAMGSVVLGGQTLSLGLTLLATPVVFSWFDDLAHSRWVKLLGRAITAPVAAVDRLFTRKETSDRTAIEERPVRDSEHSLPESAE